MIASPIFIDRYLEYFSFVPKEDYLLLADIKDKNKEFPLAIKYLEKYKNNIKDSEMKNNISIRNKSLKNKLTSPERTYNSNSKF